MFKAFSVFILFITSQFLAGVFSLMMVNWDNITRGEGIDWLRAGEVNPTALSLSYWLSYLLLLTLLWLLRLMGESPAQSFTKGYTRQGLSLIAAFVIAAFGLSLLLSPLQLDDLGHLQRLLSMRESLLGVSLLCFGGPLIEEIVFRDGIQRHLSHEVTPWLAIVISALSFAIVHMNLAQAVPAFILGVGLGWLYHKTQDLRLCLPAHVLNNSLALLTADFCPMERTFSQFPPVLLIAGGTVVFVFGVGMFYKTFRS